MRNLTAGLQTEVDTQFATEPFIFLQVQWAVTGTRYYGDKDATWSGNTVEGRIIDFSAVGTQSKQGDLGSISTVSVTLSDDDGSMKSLINCEEIEGTEVAIVQWYEGLVAGDNLVLLTGVIVSDITWEEGARTLSFSVEVKVNSEEVGYAPEAGDFTQLNNEAIGVPWPHVYGTALMVPCAKIKAEIRGELKEDINNTTATYGIINGKSFPQDPTVITLDIARLIVTGTMIDETFTPTAKNVAYATGIAVAARPIDPDSASLNVLWLSTYVDCVGMFFLMDVGAGPEVNQCIGLDPTTLKAFFAKEWSSLAGPPDIITEMAIAVRGAWGVTFSFITGSIDYDLPVDEWFVAKGALVKQRSSPAILDTCVANLYPSSSVLEVWGTRTLNGEDIYVQIPSSYYSVDLAEVLGTKTATTLTFEKSLLDYECENWTGEVFVSLVSSVGPKINTVIKYVIDNFTSLGSNNASFTQLGVDVGDLYPVGFARTTVEDALQFAQSIAFQGRVGIWIDSLAEVKVKYLGTVPSADVTIDISNTAFKTLSTGFTPTEDIKTRLKAAWFRHYGPSDFVDQGEWTTIYENNIDRYGLLEDNIDMFIYNIAELVGFSLQFWGYRWSNSWRRNVSQATISEIAVEAFDTLGYSIAEFSTNTIRGVIESISFDTLRPVITFTTELGARSGDCDGGNQPQEDTGYWTGNGALPAGGPPADIGSGLAQIDYIPETDYACINTISIVDIEREPRRLFLKVRAWDDYTGAGTGRPRHVFERGDAFGIAIQLQDANGRRVALDPKFDITWIGSDLGDTLNLVGGTLVDGAFSTDVAEITGGVDLIDRGIFRVTLDKDSTPFDNVIIEGIDSPQHAVVAENFIQIKMKEIQDEKDYDANVKNHVSIETDTSGDVETAHDDDGKNQDTYVSWGTEGTVFEDTGSPRTLPVGVTHNIPVKENVKDTVGFGVIVSDGVNVGFVDGIKFAALKPWQLIPSTSNPGMGKEIHVQPAYIYRSPRRGATCSSAVSFDAGAEVSGDGVVHFYAILMSSIGPSSNSANINDEDTLSPTNDAIDGIFIYMTQDVIDWDIDFFNQVYLIGSVTYVGGEITDINQQLDSHIYSDTPYGSENDDFSIRKTFTNVANLTEYRIDIGDAHWHRRDIEKFIVGETFFDSDFVGSLPEDNIWVTEVTFDTTSAIEPEYDPSLCPLEFVVRREADITIETGYQNCQKLLYEYSSFLFSGITLSGVHRAYTGGEVRDDWVRPDGVASGYAEIDTPAIPTLEGMDFSTAISPDKTQNAQLQDRQAYEKIVINADIANCENDHVLQYYDYSEAGKTFKEYARTDSSNHTVSCWNGFASIEIKNEVIQIRNVDDPTMQPGGIGTLTDANTGAGSQFLIAARDDTNAEMVFMDIDLTGDTVTCADINNLGSDCIDCTIINFDTDCVPCDSVDWTTTPCDNKVPCEAIDTTSPVEACLDLEHDRIPGVVLDSGFSGQAEGHDCRHPVLGGEWDDDDSGILGSGVGFQSIGYRTTPDCTAADRIVIDLLNVVVYDAGGLNISADFDDRQGYNFAGSVPTILWGDGELRDQAIGNEKSLNWFDRQGFDSTPVISIDWDGRTLHETTGVPVLDWGALGGPNVPVGFDYGHEGVYGDTIAVTGGNLVSGGIVVNVPNWQEVEIRTQVLGMSGTQNVRVLGVIV